MDTNKIVPMSTNFEEITDRLSKLAAEFKCYFNAEEKDGYLRVTIQNREGVINGDGQFNFGLTFVDNAENSPNTVKRLIFSGYLGSGKWSTCPEVVEDLDKIESKLRNYYAHRNNPEDLI